MPPEKITVKVKVLADQKKVWEYYTQPEHIIHWNFADASWHCPTASNDMKVGGRYVARMEAKNGEYGFDFEAVYTEIKEMESFGYEFGGRSALVKLLEMEGQTEITVSFDPETVNSIELQRAGWQAILENFKKYTEAN